jgi:hypothetical protein
MVKLFAKTSNIFCWLAELAKPNTKPMSKIKALKDVFNVLLELLGSLRKLS